MNKPRVSGHVRRIGSDWYMDCCGDQLVTYSWRSAMQAAYGHLCMKKHSCEDLGGHDYEQYAEWHNFCFCRRCGADGYLV